MGRAARRAARPTAAALVVALAAVILAACAPSPAELPDGVTSIVFQPRTEVASGRLAIRISNDSDEPITILRAEYDSPDYSEPIVWKRHDARLAPGTAIDLRVDPVRPACPDAPPAEAASVVLDFRVEGGATGQAVLEPGDPWDHFPKIPEALCLGQLLEDATAVATDRIESDGQPRHPGTLVLSLTPSGGDATATLDAVRSSILIGILGPDGEQVQRLPLGLELTGTDAPQELRFTIAPGRCDTHAIAEDKVGTLLPIDVTAGSRSGTMRLPSSDEFRAQVYAFVQHYCA